MTLTLQGNGTLNGLTVLGAPVTTLANTGTAASPSLVFDGDSDTGLFRPGANQLALSVGGSARLTIASDGVTTFTNSVQTSSYFQSTRTVGNTSVLAGYHNSDLNVNIRAEGSAYFTGEVIIGGSAALANSSCTINDDGYIFINRSSGNALIVQQNGGGTSSDNKIALGTDGDGEFGQASNATNNNGVLIGGSNGSLNLYTTRYSTDCAQILNTSGSGNNIAHQFFGNGTLKVCGGHLQFANVTSDSSNSVRITTDPASGGSGSKLIFNLDSSQDAVTIYNSGLKVGDSVNTERINLKGSDGGADFTGIITTNSPTYLSTVCQIQTDAKNTEAYSPTTIYNSQTIELHNSVSMGSAIIRFRSQSSNGAAGLWNIGAVPRTASTGADFIFQSRNTSGSYNESIRLLPDGGIKFNVAGAGLDFSLSEGSGATSSVLDDYEEGTWTPVLKSGTNTITYTGGDSKFTYTKIGNVVTVNFTFNNETTAGTTGGVFSVEGLPFAAVSTQANRFIGTIVNYYNLGLYLNGWPAYAHLDAGQSKINVYYKTANNGQYDAATVSNVGSSSFMQWQITYFT